MPKCWVKNYFAHGSFPEVGQKQETEKKEREKERKRDRAKVGENNGQATHGARKPPGPKIRVLYNQPLFGKESCKVFLLPREWLHFPNQTYQHRVKELTILELSQTARNKMKCKY